MRFFKWLKNLFTEKCTYEVIGVSYCYRAPDNSGRIFKVLEGFPFKETDCFKGECNCDIDGCDIRFIEGPTDTYFKDDEE